MRQFETQMFGITLCPVSVQQCEAGLQLLGPLGRQTACLQCMHVALSRQTHSQTDLDKLQNFQKVPNGAVGRQSNPLGQGLGPPCPLPQGLLQRQRLCSLRHHGLLQDVHQTCHIGQQGGGGVVGGGGLSGRVSAVYLPVMQKAEIH